MSQNTELPVAVIGAGPAGLTAAYKLAQAQVPVVVFESSESHVGGISRTETYKGFRFDIGGHRFFSKSPEIEALWTEILGDDLIERPRSSRIYFRGKLFKYPLSARDALGKLGVLEAALCLLSYVKARVKPVAAPKSFEDWVTNQFGARLFRMFFQTYTEKVWGMSCKDISADWAAQRIKGLSLLGAIKNAFYQAPHGGDRTKTIKTLIDSFRYPRLGPGMMWERCAQKITALGGDIRMGCKVTGLTYDESEKVWMIDYQSAGRHQRVKAREVISSAPIAELIPAITPSPSAKTLAAACALRYRDFLTVAIIAKSRPAFADNWIYIHDPGVKVGRIQNFRAWSQDMVPSEDLTCYGMEYFCFEGDGVWSASDASLLALARDELARLGGLVDPRDIVDGCVIRQPKAYPVYDEHYGQNVKFVRQELAKSYPGLHLVGRNGMHKYNNQDHAMMTAILTVKNIIAGAEIYDVWQVNEDAEYHESASFSGERELGARLVPQPIIAASQDPYESSGQKSLVS